MVFHDSLKYAFGEPRVRMEGECEISEQFLIFADETKNCMTKKINILLCDKFTGLLPDYIPSYVWMFTRLFDATGCGVTYAVYPVMEDCLPRSINQGEIYLITGCNLSAYDDVTWIKNLLDWIMNACSANALIVGICFGHQAIAQALGGKVEQATVGWGIGIRESNVVDEAALAYFPDGRMRLLYNHHDQVTRLPNGAVLTATSNFCPIESFRMGKNVLAFQGHPEYIPKYEEHLLNNFADEEPIAVRETALQSLSSMQHQGSVVARWILDMA